MVNNSAENASSIQGYLKTKNKKTNFDCSATKQYGHKQKVVIKTTKPPQNYHHSYLREKIDIKKTMTQIEWAMWANEQAIASSLIIILGGIIGISGSFAKWQFAVYAVVAGLVVIIMEYPRSLRAKGKSTPRRLQFPFTVFLNALGPLGRNYYFRVFFYFMLCVPCVFLLPTLLGGICLLISSILYFVAALKGECWKADLPQNEEATENEGITAPTMPPPRKPRVFTTPKSAAVL